MRDGDKTKAELMDELAELRACLAEYKQREEVLRGRVKVLESSLTAAMTSGSTYSRELELLNRASQAFISTLDLDQVLAIVLEEVRYSLDVVACSAWLIDSDTEELVCRQVTDPQSKVVRGWRLAPGQGLAGWVAAHGQSLVVADIERDQRHFKGVDEQTGLPIQSILTVPLKVKEKTIGVIQVVDEKKGRFNAVDQQVVESLASTAAIAVENARLFEALRASKEYARNIIDSSLDMIITVDMNRRIVEFNRAAQETFGYSPAEIVGKHVDVLYGNPAEALAVHQKVVEEGQHIQEIFNQRKNGELFPCFVSASLLHDPDGKVVGVMGVSRDITESKRAKERLEKLNQCFLHFGSIPDENIQRLVEVCGELLNATCALYNRLQDRLLCSVGQWKTPPDYVPVDEAEGHLCYDVIQKGVEVPLLVRDLQTSPYAVTDPNVKSYQLQTYIGIAVKWQKHAIGSLCVVYQDNVEPSREDLHLLNIIAAAIGVEEERRRTEEQIEIALHEKEVLLKEIHHRVKNNLQIISSLLDLQSDTIPNRQIQEAFLESRNRIQSMADIHEQLYHSKDLARIDMAAYIKNLVPHLQYSYGAESVAIQLDINQVMLDIDRAIPCGLIINELVTNALKHAFPPRDWPTAPVGRIYIALHPYNKDRIELVVSDNGVGLPIEANLQNAKSLGLRLVSMLTRQLEGSIALECNQGTTFRLNF